MDVSYNTDPEMKKDPKTSSTDSKENSKTTGDSQVQDGEGVERSEQQEKAYEKSDVNQEYLEQANNNTATGNESPVKDGKGMTMSAYNSESNDEGDDNNDDLPSTQIGDNPDETDKKIPMM